MFDVIVTKRDWTEQLVLSCEGHPLAVEIAQTTLKNHPSEYIRALVLPAQPEEQVGDAEWNS